MKYPTIVMCLCLPILAAASARAQVVVELRCWEGSSEGPSLAVLTFDDVMKPHGCKILVSNNSGVALDDATFTLDFGVHSAVPLSNNPLTGNLDAGAHYDCQESDATLASTVPPSASSFVPGMVVDVDPVFPGFPGGLPVLMQSSNSEPYNGRCWEFHLTPRAQWKFDIAAGDTSSGPTATMRVEFKSGYSLQGASFSTAATVTTTNLPAGVTATTPSLPIVVATPAHPLDAGADPAPDLTPSLALGGTLWVGTSHYSVRGANTGMNADLYLPYLRPASGGGLELALDGGYDAGLGHALLFDPTDLELNVGFSNDGGYLAGRFRDAATAEDTTTAGGYPFPFVYIDDDHYHLDLGYFPGNPGNRGHRRVVVSWAAAFSQAPTVQDWLAGRTTVVTGRICGRSDQSGEVCAQTSPALYTPSMLIARLQSQWRFTTDSLLALTEASAVSPLSTLTSAVIPPPMPWRDVSLTAAIQVPNDSLGHRGHPQWTRMYTVHVPRPHEVFASTSAADTSSEADLLARTVPLSAPGTFVSLGTIDGPYVAVSPDVRELTMSCQPSRMGVRNFGMRLGSECHWLVDWTVPVDASPSIDGSTYLATDMTRASLGATGFFAATASGSAAFDVERSFNVEVDGGSRHSLTLTYETEPNETARQVWAATDRTTNQFASAGCVFANLGLDNVEGPLRIEVEWPAGFQPYGLDAMPPTGVRALYGDGTLAAQGGYWGTVVGAPAPETAYTIEVDAAARTAAVEFDGPRADGSFPRADQVSAPLDYTDARWVQLRIEGEYLPGADRFPTWDCTATIGRSVAPDGTVLVDAERVITDGVPFRILGAPAPRLAGSSSPTLVPSGTAWTSTLDLRNSAYDALTELPLADGADVSARDGVVYFRVPRDGDIAAALQNGSLSVRFSEATSADALAIWVSTAEIPALRIEPDLASDTDWVECAASGQPCDAAALGVLTLAPEDVRWIAFALGEVHVTDGEPRGVRPTDTAERVEAPYLAQVHMSDVASDDGVLVRSRAVFVSSDTLPLDAPVDAYDVVIDNDCSCTEPNAYFAPVANSAGQIVGAIRCVAGPTGSPVCDIGADTDGDGQPNLVIYPEQGGICAP